MHQQHLIVKQLKRQLLALERALQQAELWSQQPPAPTLLQSREPFAVDTLRFEQWLQWIFIPKLRKLLAMPRVDGLPNASDVHTMAVHQFNRYPQKTDDICVHIQAIDDGLNRLLK